MILESRHEHGAERTLSPEEIRQLNRSLMEKVASDPEWKQRLLDDPEAAMMETGFLEARQLEEMHTSLLKE